MTKVKICGITNLEDALLSVKFGADALGFNFYAKSPRYILPENAREIIEQLPAETLKVGVFVNESLDKIAEIAETAKLNALQLHGEETPEFAKELKLKTDLEIIKAFRVSPTFTPEDVLKYEVDAILLDAYNPKEHGGTGETFDWEMASKLKSLKINFPKLYLAGGLYDENVTLAIRRVRPFAVDACSLLEKQKGIKNKWLIQSFVYAAKSSLREDKDYKLISKKQEDFDIYDLLESIEQRPEMYFGRKSFSALRNFLRGFQYGVDFYDKNRFSWGKFYSENYEDSFSHFVVKKLQGKDYTPAIGFWGVISEEVNYDNEKAFDLFFELLEQYKVEVEKIDTVEQLLEEFKLEKEDLNS